MNFRSQKGATGTDVIIAITVIVLSVAVVSMIYVNTTLQSRNVTRMAGATRIATNILENIEKLSYTDFDAEYSRIKGTESVTISIANYTTYPSATNTTVFSTKIPKGYTVYLYGEPNYGSYTASTDGDKKFDLVRDIKLVVTFKVGDMNKVIDFSTSKTREITEEVNPPDTTVLVSQGIASDTKKIYPIKYSVDANAYMKTAEDDAEWYSYSNKKWAMVIVSTKTESQLFDVNGKLTASSDDYAKYVWVPRFFTNGSGDTEKITEFAYLSSDKAIKANQELTAVDGTTKLYYNTLENKASTSNLTTYFTLSGNQEVSGKWISVSEISSQVETKLLTASVYGPYELY